MKAVARLGLVLAAAVATLAAAAHASARETCAAGTHTTGSVTYHTFCGPAHATLKVGGKTYSFKGGSCERVGELFSINIGTTTRQRAKSRWVYFGITVFAKKDGTYRNEAVYWEFPHGNGGALVRTTIKIAGGRKHGTFSGVQALGRGKGTGSFSCS
jgi:hypothetical protein